MTTIHDPSNKKLTHNYHPTTIFRWPTGRRLSFRRRRLPIVRLGGKKSRRRWLKLKYSCMLKKLKNYYNALVKKIIEANGTVESFQQMMLLETSFIIPVMGLSFNA
ncbi:hypothetical protein Adt_10449 [Abeliophyllum distichum]|uniref:Uncharacterized protein n=1 Tax=Abeliophyllum distichum TaxID=126358 RepID=A0ABD1ULH7_9LAMI